MRPKPHPARCPAEAQLGETATAELQRLLNQGPFIHDRAGSMTCSDFYGRELRTVTRIRADGNDPVDCRSDMMASGTVRRYWPGPARRLVLTANPAVLGLLR